MKKLVFLSIVIVLALALDGMLSYGIFDLDVGSVTLWTTALILVGIFLAIAWADATKKHENKNNPG